MDRTSAPTAHAKVNLAMSALYSATFLKTMKFSLRVYSIFNPLGPKITTPAPALFMLEAPYTYMFQLGLWGGRCA